MTALPDRPPPSPQDAERALALSYAAPSARAALGVLFALDATLARIVRTTREPIVGQMRLTWWHAALTALDTAPPPAEPVLQALHAQVLPQGVTGARLAAMIDGWEVLLDGGAIDDTALVTFAQARGGGLFAAAGQVLGGTPIAAAGEGWSLADLAAHLTVGADRARDVARERLSAAFAARWPAALRSLGALALLARFDVMAPSPTVAGPRRVTRLAWHRMTGR